MKNNKPIILSLSLFALLGSLTLGLASCDNQDSTPSDSSSTNEKAIENIEVDKTSISLKVGDKETLTISVTPSSFALTDLNYEYDDTIISFNSETIEITALKEGSTTLKIKGGSITKEVAIVVTKNDIKVTSLTCSFSKKTMSVGDTFQLEIGHLPENAADPTLFFFSDTTSVVSVSKTGLMKAVSKGSANVLVSVQGDSSVTPLTLAITVSEDKEEVTRDNLIEKVEEASANEATKTFCL